MAKAKADSSRKVVFGKRKGRRPAKFKGPKDKPVSKYRGQGR